MVSRLGFVLFFTGFLFFVIQISAIFGTTIIEGFDGTAATVNTNSLTILTFPLFILDNFFVFLQLMATSSEFLILGTIILPIFIIGMIWSIIEVIAIAIP